MWSDLEFSATAVQGVLTFTGRLKNVGERDARYVGLKVSMRNVQKREVGRGNVQKHDGLKSGASWWFDGILTVREPGAVEASLRGRALLPSDISLRLTATGPVAVLALGNLVTANR